LRPLQLVAGTTAFCFVDMVKNPFVVGAGENRTFVLSLERIAY
jgi:hypothetical protein